MTNPRFNVDQMLINEWRQLRFYYDFDERVEVNQWRFFGSKNGLNNFVNLLDKYINDPGKKEVSEHDHYGPYSYLKIMTWSEPIITREYIAGTIPDLKKLRDILIHKISITNIGQTFNIDKDFGVDNTVTTKFFVMSDDFDPVTMDELIISGRQEVANKHRGL